ncbi:hypothetical protein RKD54_004510 [Pseudarthrobacter sp. SLBN-100]
MINRSREDLPALPKASALISLDVVKVRARQTSNPSWLHRISNIPALAHTARRIRFDQTIIFKSFQMPVQARSAYVQLGLELPDRRGTKNGQLPQDVRLSPVAHESHCGLDIWRKIRSDQSGHASILPDFPLNHHNFPCLTLLLNKRVRAAALFMWSREVSCPQRLGLISDTFCASTTDLATKTDAAGLLLVGPYGGLR